MFFLIGADFGISLLVMGVALAASLLLKPKPKGAIADKEATTTASRGSYVPLVIGLRRTGPAVLWVGEREVRKESGGKGKGGLFGGPKQQVFYEAAWHGLAVGPGYALHRIWADGRLIWTGPISIGTHASGTTINVPGEGDFQIYWGEETPAAADAYLSNATRVGIASGWPLLMYVIWRPKKLGLAPRWPNIEYEIEVRPYGTSLAGGSSWFTSTAGPLGDDAGANPAHVLEQILLAPHPHGMGFSQSLFDIDALKALSTLFGTEHLGVSVIARNGGDFESVISTLMTDCGFLMPRVDGKTSFVPIRTPGLDFRVLYEDAILPPRPEVDARIGGLDSNALMFTFTDRARDYRPNTIGDANDGPDITSTRRNVKEVPLESITCLGSAASVVRRRAQEELSLDTRIRVISNHTSRDIYPGQVIGVADIPYLLRVLSVKSFQLTNRVEIDATPDYFGVFTTWTPELGGTSGGGIVLVPSDSSVIDAPPWRGGPPTGGGEPTPAALSIIRARGDNQVLGAEIWISVDDVTYVNLGSHNGLAFKGQLDEELPITGKTYLDSGPLVTFTDRDLNLMQDLSTNLAAWATGHQAVYIAGELLYVQRFEAISGLQYRMRGVYRSRRGMIKKTHVIGTSFYVFSPEDATTVIDPMIAAADPIYVKLQPYAWSGARDLSLVTAVQLAKADRATHIPLGVFNLRCNTVRGHHDWTVISTSATFKWNYASASNTRSACGQQLPGEAVATQPPSGTFELELLLNDGVTVVHTASGITDASYVLAWATLESYVGALSVGDTFYVRVREHAFGQVGYWSTLLVTVVS